MDARGEDGEELPESDGRVHRPDGMDDGPILVVGVDVEPYGDVVGFEQDESGRGR